MRLVWFAESQGAALSKSNASTSLIDRYEKLLTTVVDKLERWHEYKEELFDDLRQLPEKFHLDENNIDPEITNADVFHTVNNMSNGKAADLNEIPIDVFKILVEATLLLIVNLIKASRSQVK